MILKHTLIATGAILFAACSVSEQNSVADTPPEPPPAPEVVVDAPAAREPEEIKTIPPAPDCTGGVHKQGGLILCRNGVPGSIVKMDGKAVAKFDASGRASIGLAQKSPLEVTLTLPYEGSSFTETLTIEKRVDDVRYLTLDCDQIDARTQEQKDHAARAWVWKQNAFKTLADGDGFWNGISAPANAPTSSPFGPTRHYKGVSAETGEECNKTSVHRGQDFATPTGTPLLAPADGVVTLADELYYEGNAIFLDHGQGLVSIFMHLSAFDVEPGDVVKAGDLIGKTGNTGRSTGPHLHWAVKWQNTATDDRSGDYYIDPAVLLKLAD